MTMRENGDVFLQKRFHVAILSILYVLLLNYDANGFAVDWKSVRQPKRRGTASQHSYCQLKPARTATDLDDANDDTDDDGDEVLSTALPSSTSLQFAMDPYDDRANFIMQRLGMTSQQHEQLADLSSLVVEWNQRLNLISRRDCTVPVVFGRHVLPSISLCNLILNTTTASATSTTSSRSQQQKQQQKQQKPLRIVDIGTGGGFPGLPLAIALPHAQILCVDSVGKKVRAVQAMVDELQLPNVQTFSGRAEEMTSTTFSRPQPDYDESFQHEHHDHPTWWKHGFDIVVGRSVTALPNFCHWIQDLMKPNTGRLLYIIGGTIDDEVLTKVQLDVDIDQLLLEKGISDKRVLVLDAAAVRSIAATASTTVLEERISKPSRQPNRPKNGKPQPRRQPLLEPKQQQQQQQRRRRTANEEDNYDNFRRYNNF